MKTYDQIRVSIVDYGLGNLFSIKHAWNHIGIKAEITSSKDTILNSNLVVLPGVGAFADAMYSLNSLDLSNTIKEVAQSETFIISICLGMQLLMSKSYEFGEHNGLGLIKGEVIKLEKGQNYPIPHIGWSQIIFSNSKVESNFFLKNISKASYFYFIHSYQVKNANKEEALCYTNYGKNYFSSIINENNIFGTQFHPEKSGRAGEKLLLNFLTN